MIRRLKVWMLTAMCTGLVAVTSGQAFGLGGGLFGKKGGGDCCPAPACNTCAAAPAASAPCGATQKITVQEWVPTYVDQVVTTYTKQMQNETYTAYRWECVPETKTVQVTVMKSVCETVMVNKCITERIPVTKTVTVMQKRPVTKTITVMQSCTKTVKVTEMRTKTVSHKISVPTCVTVGPSLCDRIKAKCDPCYCPCPKTKQVCKHERVCETVCCPVTVCKKVTECVPVCKTICTYECVPCTKQVCTYECVTKQVQVPCTVRKCVPVCENRTCTTYTKKCVAYQACRQTCVCVPCTKTVKVCKMVCQSVVKDVPCAAPCCSTPSCSTGCCDTGCNTGCSTGCKKMKCHMHHMKKQKNCCTSPCSACGTCGGC